ncbi:TPA: DUF2905 domain-containing protein [Candidatus Bipolaricaulota bacterium]|nr:DUF2905 domain-containing protein [Candidatus Bipolaricaulota bacterium]
MEGFSGLGRMLVLLGIGLVILGLWLWGKLPFLGRLPGDIRIERDGLVIYIPLASMLLLSLVLSLLFSLWRR